MGFVYKITNSINGKMYIGQTSRDIFVRWKEHIRDSSDKPSSIYFSLLHLAIRKYGADAFTVECVEECDDSVLDEREQYWIQHFQTRGDGYNITRGGQGTLKCDNAEIMKLWNDGLAVKEISAKTGISKQIVSKRLRYQGVGIPEILSRGNKGNGTRKVVRISFDGKETKVYNSLTEAAEDNNIGTGRICMVCNGERISAGGYRWQYYDETVTHFAPIPESELPKREVYQYSLNGDYIRSFDSMCDAAKSVGKESISGIRNVCMKERGYAYGYKWRFYKSDSLKAI